AFKQDIYRQVAEFDAELKKQLDPKKKTVVFWSAFNTYRSHFGSLPKLLKEKYNVVVVVNDEINDEFETQNMRLALPWRLQYNGETVFLDEIKLSNIDLIITVDTVGYLDGKIDKNFISPTAKRMYIPHSMIIATGMSDIYDFFVVPSKMMVDEYEQRLANNGKKQVLIKAGYPRFDNSLNKFDHKVVPDKILYAPSLRYAGAPNEVNQYGGFDWQVMEALHEATGLDVIYRAHPLASKYNHQIYNLIKAKMATYPFVKLAADNVSDYEQAKFIVTDISTTAYTFSFQSNRPSIFYAPLEVEIPVVKYADSVGCVVKTIDELKQRAVQYANHQPSEQIMKFRDENIFNVGGSEAVIVESIDAILSGKKHKSWSSVN
ncbi:MAG TPA: CDP-glycerol glycerophosphotransferase family protein, partial [Campylobacterales bacterium]|nr:CDP-glycerol glycerophosphotransferase family protein [Campylobacterales bacterium]